MHRYLVIIRDPDTEELDVSQFYFTYEDAKTEYDNMSGVVDDIYLCKIIEEQELEP